MTQAGLIRRFSGKYLWLSCTRDKCCSKKDNSIHLIDFQNVVLVLVVRFLNASVSKSTGETERSQTDYHASATSAIFAPFRFDIGPGESTLLLCSRLLFDLHLFCSCISGPWTACWPSATTHTHPHTWACFHNNVIYNKTTNNKLMLLFSGWH